MAVYIRVDPVLETRAIANFDAFLDAFPELATETVEDAWRKEIEPEFTSEVQWYPGPSQNSLNSGAPFVWSLDPAANARARRWWFANFPNGRERTGKLAESYQVAITQGDGIIAISVRNTAPYHQWVKGRRQIPGHLRTGWPLDKEIMDFWAEASREVIIDAVIGLVSGKAFVRR